MTIQEWSKKAQRHEESSEWEEAADSWRMAGNNDEAYTCDFIAESVRKGDLIRDTYGYGGCN